MELKAKEIIAVLIPFFIAVSVCYLFGYWGAFKINVLEFITFGDVAKLAIYPIMGSLIFTVAGAVMSDVSAGHRLPPGGGVGSPISNFGFQYWRAIFALLILMIVLVVLYMPESVKWHLAIFLSLPFYLPFFHMEAVVKAVPSTKARSTIAMAFILLPGLAFAIGRDKAYQVKTGNSALLVDAARSNLPLLSDSKNPLAYMGLLGETYLIFESKTNTIVLIQKKADSPLFLLVKKQ